MDIKDDNNRKVVRRAILLKTRLIQSAFLVADAANLTLSSSMTRCWVF